MSKIDAAFSEISQADKDALMDAFDNLTSMVIPLKDNKFLGVHLIANNNMIIEETTGYWFYGSYK